MNTEVEVGEYSITEKMIRVRVMIPILDVGVTYYRRLGSEGYNRNRWGWYCNETNGFFPDTKGLQELLDALARQHPVLSKVMDSTYGYPEAANDHN